MSEPRPSTSEYHDPDYPDVPASAARTIQTSPRQKVQKIIAIVKKEFDSEIQSREDELDNIDQRVLHARRTLHRLRYAIVNSYYQNSKLRPNETEIQEEVKLQQDIKASDEVLSILRNEQRRLHPSLRKLLGKKEADLGQLITYQPRPRQRKDYSAMVTSGLNTTTVEDKAQKSLRTQTPLKEDPVERNLKRLQDEPVAELSDPKVPRYIAPKGLDNKVVKVNETSRNKKKVKYRILVGNTSRFIPPSSTVDRSTHRWLLYIRGPKDDPDVSHFITGVVVELHESYQPHHIVHLNRSPFHLSRRGWGEFPVKLEIRFANPVINRPINVVHNLKLDRKYTGLQTLGSETIVDVWLYADGYMRKPINMDVPSDNSNLEDGQTDSSCQNSDSECGSVTSAKKRTAQRKNINGQRNSVEHDAMPPLEIKEMSPIKIKEEILDIPFEPEGLDDAQVCVKDGPNVSVKDKLNDDSNYDLPPHISKDKKIIKCIDKNTGRILYLELDPGLPLGKMNEIIINNVKDKNNLVTATPIFRKDTSAGKRNGLASVGKKMSPSPRKGMSLLKSNQVNLGNFPHLQHDHCYIQKNQSASGQTTQPLAAKMIVNMVDDLSVSLVKDHLQDLTQRVARIDDVRCAVNFLLRNIPIVTQHADVDKYRAQFPFTVSSSLKFYEYHPAKRRSIEWSRAKLIQNLLEPSVPTEQLMQRNWTTRQILVYSRLHGFGVPNPDLSASDSTPFDLMHISKGVFKSARDICTMSRFNASEAILNSSNRVTNIKLEPSEAKAVPVKTSQIYKSIPIPDSSSDEDVDISSISTEKMKYFKNSPHKSKNVRPYTVLPIDNQAERWQCLFIEKTCAQLGIELRNEFVGNNQVHSLAHKTMLTALKLFVEELLRLSLAQKIRKDLTNLGGSDEEQAVNTRPAIWSDTRVACESQPIELQDVYEAIKRRSRFHFLTNSGLGEEKISYDDNL